MKTIHDLPFEVATELFLNEYFRFKVEKESSSCSSKTLNQSQLKKREKNEKSSY
jgi:hypothetical protein